MIGRLRRYLARRALGRSDSVDPRLSNYAALHFDRWQGAALRDARFVVLDTETTGLDVATSALLSLAAVEVRGGRVHLDTRFEVTFAHEHVGGRAAAPIHGLLPSDLRDGTPAQQGVIEFLDFAGDAILVGHHVDFDIAMLDGVLSHLGPVRLYNRRADTNRLVGRLTSATLPRDGDAPPRHSLDRLCEIYDIPIPMRHTAAGDALATAMLWLVLLGRARRRGITTAGRLLAR